MKRHTWPRAHLQRAVFWLAAALILAAPVWLGANRPVPWTALSLGLLALLAVQMALDAGSAAAAGLWRGAWPFALPFLAVLAWAAVQAGPAPLAGWAHPAWAEIGLRGSISADPAAGWQGVMRLSGYGAAFWIAARSMGARDQAVHFIDALALTAVALALFGIGAVVAGTNPVTGPTAYPGAVTSTFVSRNTYSFHAGIGAMACVAALVFRLPRGRSAGGARAGVTVAALVGRGAPWLIALIIVLAPVLMSGSRAGALATVLGLVVAVFLMARGRGRLIGVTAVLCVVGALGLQSELLAERLAAVVPVENKRVALWGHMLDAVAAAPWRGHGLGAFQDAFRSYMPAGFSGAEWDKGHNSYLENAVELGLPATALLVLAVAVIGWQTLAGLGRRQRMRPAVALGLGVLAAGAAHSALDFSLQVPATATLFAMLLGLSWGLARCETPQPWPGFTFGPNRGAASPHRIEVASTHPTRNMLPTR